MLSTKSNTTGSNGFLIDYRECEDGDSNIKIVVGHRLWNVVVYDKNLESMGLCPSLKSLCVDILRLGQICIRRDVWDSLLLRGS